MTKEIKFRIWSNSYNKYIENYAKNSNETFGEGRYGYEGYHLALRPDGKLYDADVGIDYPGSWSEIPTLDWEDESEDNEVELSTGLKDKNGKEIYEGDIIRENIEVGDDDIDGEYRYQIVWDEETLCWSLSPNYGAIHKDLWETNQNREVIGNIHENPELI